MTGFSLFSCALLSDDSMVELLLLRDAESVGDTRNFMFKSERL